MPITRVNRPVQAKRYTLHAMFRGALGIPTGLLVIASTLFLSTTAHTKEEEKKFELKLKAKAPVKTTGEQRFVFEEANCSKTAKFQEKKIKKDQVEFLMTVLRKFEYPRSEQASLTKCFEIPLSETGSALAKREILFEQCTTRWNEVMKALSALPTSKDEDVIKARNDMTEILELIRTRHLASLKFLVNERETDLNLGGRWTNIEKDCKDDRNKVTDVGRWKHRYLASLAPACKKGLTRAPASVNPGEPTCESQLPPIPENEVESRALEMAVGTWAECVDHWVNYQKYRTAISTYREFYVDVNLQACE